MDKKIYKKKATKYNTREIISSLWQICEKKRKVQFIFLISLMLLSGLLESFTIRLVIPVLSTLLNRGETTLNDTFFYEKILSLNTFDNEIKVFYGIIIFSLIVLFATLLKLLTLWFNERFSALVGNDVSHKSFSIALRLPYSEHINKNSSEKIAILIQYVDETVYVLKMFLKAIYYSIISFFIIYGLISLNFKITIISIFTISFLYLFFSNLSKKILIKNGSKISLSYSNQTKYVQESLGAIRDIILNRNYKVFEDKFEKQDFIKRKAIGTNTILSAYPKILLEGFGVIFLSLLAYGLNILYPNNAVENIGLIAAFSLGCQKILPAIQSIYISISRFRGGTASLIKVINLIKSFTNGFSKSKSRVAA